MKFRRITRITLALGLAGSMILATGPSSLLLLVGETRPGRIFGAAALGLFAASLCLVVLMGRSPANPRPWWVACWISSLIAAGFAVTLVSGATPADPERSSGLVSRSFGGRTVPRVSPFRLVPEIDQVNLALTLATRPLFWSGRARTIRETTMGLYREMETDPDARWLGPVTHFAVLELLGARFDAEHSFAYVPATRPGERLGAVVFLHGNGGNFQAMPWAWRAFAETQRLAILCPTFGFGFWGEGGVEAVDRAWDDARKLWPIDPDRVYLAGLSDGGVGVTRSAQAHPERYQGLIYVSPTMKLEELGSAQFVGGWRGRPVLVFQGDRDVNVPKETVDPAVALLGREGVDVDYRVFPGEDHFLFFSRPRELFAAMGEWMGKIPALPAVSKESR